MATDEAPSRADQVFADGRLIDEVMQRAARRAIRRHGQEREPLVILRDGQIAHVPVDDLLKEPLLTDAELAAERIAKDFVHWFEDRLSVINDCADVKQLALRHQGLFKKFYEELYPLALFLRHVYADRKDVTCSLNCQASGNRDYDAVIRDHAIKPPTLTYVQLTTTTFDRDESRRMQYFLEHGWVPVWGQIDETGNVEMEFVEHEQLLERTFEVIERVAKRKSGFSYGADYVLVVSFDDFMWFGTDDDLAALTSFVGQSLASWRLKVATLYIVGISGRTFLSFAVPRG